MLAKHAAGMAGAPPVMDIHEFLAGGAGETGHPGLAPARNELPTGRVTWHDPCHLGRGLWLTREPREIIAALPGVEYVESGELSCCGGGGVFGLTHYGLSLKVGMARAEEIAATGAGLVVTGCPGCRLQLTDALSRLDSPAKVVHTVELLGGSP
jgi:glycolate oxidase iron-sulfur subunit